MRPIREPRVPPPGAPTEIHPGLVEPRVYLDVLRRHHVDLVKRFLEADGGNIFTIDLFLTGVAARSHHLVGGFLALFDEWNVISAAPIVRLQLDSLTRVSYVVRAQKADDVVNEVIKGVEFRHMRAPDGERLLDRKLVELAREHHPWMPPVYEATSGWVHLSPFHARMSWTVAAGEQEGAHLLQGRFPMRPEEIPVSALEELLGAMTQATEELFGYFEGWESRKGLPLGQVRPVGDESGENDDA